MIQTCQCACANRHAVTPKDGTVSANVNVDVHDDTGEAVLRLWAAAAESPFQCDSLADSNDLDAAEHEQAWKPGGTVLLLQAPSYKPGRVVGYSTLHHEDWKHLIKRQPYLSLSGYSMIDIDPVGSYAHWLRTWAMRERSRKAVNPPFPQGIFDYANLLDGPVRCLYTIRDLDEFARAAPTETFQGYLAVIVMQSRLLECWNRRMLCAGDCCCGTPIYANALVENCKECEKAVELRLNPRIIGQVLDETGCICPGKLLFSDRAWKQLLGRGAAGLLSLDTEYIADLSHRMAFCRVSLMFGWTGDATKAGGRICVLGVQG
nr:hypothetical protein CFP56_44416 [Quercus suber]